VTATARTDALLTGTAGDAYSLTIKGDNGTAVDISFSIGAQTDANGYAAAISAFNAQSAKTGVTASYDADNGGLKLSHAKGNTIEIGNSAASDSGITLANYDADGTAQTGVAVAAAANAVGIALGRVTLDSEQSFAATDAGSTLGVGGPSALKAVSDLDISTFDGAQLAIKIADAALSSVNGKRAELGALQSRFSSAISNLQSSTENLSASKSRITDTDFASETANMTRGQILQQAGTSMLAQANSLPNGVLSLLRG
jgi:flagellin